MFSAGLGSRKARLGSARFDSRCRGAISGAYLSFHHSAVFLSTFSWFRRGTLRFIVTSCFSFMGVIKRPGLPDKIYAGEKPTAPFKSHVDYCRIIISCNIKDRFHTDCCISLYSESYMTKNYFLSPRLKLNSTSR